MEYAGITYLESIDIQELHVDVETYLGMRAILRFVCGSDRKCKFFVSRRGQVWAANLHLHLVCILNAGKN